jgi:succinyl-diaminopimelate desuccinylase
MNPLSLLSKLIALPSVTPDDAGCIPYLSTELEKLGFTCTRVDSGPVSNLWARIGTEAPLVVFAGHTDVVATGNLDAWTHPPFVMTQVGDLLYGRGTQDMKGAIACMVAACDEFLSQHPTFKGSIGLLLTSAEEGEAFMEGTPKVLSYLESTDQKIDYCIVGEPSSHRRLGDTLKIGRRGSLHGHALIKGRQGHVAYPQDAMNAIHHAFNTLDELVKTTWDPGHEHFPATTLQISNLHAGTGALNVIPGEARIDFNIRYNPNVTHEGLMRDIDALFARQGLDYELRWVLSGEPFITSPGVLIDKISTVIRERLGVEPELSTTGGTSDARFIAKTGCEVVEFGLVNDRIHQINECTSESAIHALTSVYGSLLGVLLN